MPLVGLIESDTEEEEEEPPELQSTILERPPALYEPLINPEHLGGFFGELEAREQGAENAVHVLHVGDSTIAADGIPGVVRGRLQARFGDLGPGFLPLHVDTRWVYRPGVKRVTTGDWESWNLTQGRAPHRRYGLGGSPSRLTGEGAFRLEWKGVNEPNPELTSATIHAQIQPGGGTVRVQVGDAPPVVLQTAGDDVEDMHYHLEPDAGFRKISIEAVGDGPVSFYGVALERGRVGLSWETLGVAGSSIGSMKRQNPDHLKTEVASRNPSLLVYQTGGNALGYDSFLAGDGEVFLQKYLEVLARLRAGAPKASCLLVGPLDQGVRIRGKVQSRSEIPRMIAIQKRAAKEAGCAFWDAREVMGAEGGFARWMNHEPTLTWTDLMHLSREGSELVGERFADALMEAYRTFKQSRSSGESDDL